MNNDLFSILSPMHQYHKLNYWRKAYARRYGNLGMYFNHQSSRLLAVSPLAQAGLIAGCASQALVVGSQFLKANVL